MSQYSVVIVDYGTLLRTLQFIEDFKRICTDADDVFFIIVDNYDHNDAELKRKEAGFTKQSNSYLGWHGKSFSVYNQENIYLISVQKNVGYAKANNIGALFSHDVINAQFTIFSNNDILFPEQFSLKYFTDIFLKEKDCFVLGPEVIGVDNKRQGPVQINDRVFDLLIQPYSIFKLFIKPTRTLALPNFTYGPVHHVVGCFMIVELSKFIDVGMFDEHTFLYFEENILSERGKSKGLCFFYDSKIKIIHEGGGTIRKKVPSIKQEKLFFKSAYYYCQVYRKTKKNVLLLAKLNFKYFYIPLKWVITKIKI